MILQIINGCAGADPGLPTARTNPGWRYIMRIQSSKFAVYYLIIFYRFFQGNSVMLPSFYKTFLGAKIQDFVHNLSKDKTPSLKYQIIQHMYQKHQHKLPLAFYQNILHKDFHTKFLLHFSGFFQIYATVYGNYNRTVFQDMSKRDNSLALWRASRVDGGELVNIYLEFLETVIRHDFVLFHKEKFSLWERSFQQLCPLQFLPRCSQGQLLCVCLYKQLFFIFSFPLFQLYWLRLYWPFFS